MSVYVFTVATKQPFRDHAKYLRMTGLTRGVNVEIWNYFSEDYRWDAKIHALLKAPDNVDVLAFLDADCLIAGRPDFHKVRGMRKDPRPWPVRRIGGGEAFSEYRKKLKSLGLPPENPTPWNTGVIVGPPSVLKPFAALWMELYEWFKSVGGTSIDQPTAYLAWEKTLRGCDRDHWTLPPSYNRGFLKRGWPEAGEVEILHGAGNTKNSKQWHETRNRLMAGLSYEKPR